jgi:hypothetical protein
VLGLAVRFALPGGAARSAGDASFASRSSPDLSDIDEGGMQAAKATATRDPQVALLDLAAVLEKQGQLRAARRKVEAAAATANEVAVQCKQQGDLERAEQLLLQAHSYCRARLGSTHPETVRTVNNLAGVYEAAVQGSPPPPMGAAHGLIHPAVSVSYGNISSTVPPPVLDRHSPQIAAARSAGGAHRLTARKPQELQASVVPVLTEAFKNTNNTPERVHLAQTLGRLGPAAQEAVPVLLEQLAVARETPERQAIIEALGEMGPAAAPAVPALVASLNGPCPESREAAARALVRLGPAARNALPELNRLAADNDALAQSVVTRLQGREGRTGVYDACACFSPETVARTRRAIAALGRSADIEVLVESVSSLNEADSHKAKKDATPLGPRCIHIVVAQKPPAVRVRVGSELAQRGMTDKRSERKAAPYEPEDVDCDKLLEAAIRDVESAVPSGASGK